MSSIAKIDFVGMHSDPFDTKPPGKITTETGCSNLAEGEPEKSM